jgi:hypothetical protein
MKLVEEKVDRCWFHLSEGGVESENSDVERAS